MRVCRVRGRERCVGGESTHIDFLVFVGCSVEQKEDLFG